MHCDAIPMQFLCIVQTNHSFRRIFTLAHWRLATNLKGRNNHMKKLWFRDLSNQFLKVWDHETIATSNFAKMYLWKKFCQRKKKIFEIVIYKFLFSKLLAEIWLLPLAWMCRTWRYCSIFLFCTKKNFSGKFVPKKQNWGFRLKFSN